MYENEPIKGWPTECKIAAYCRVSREDLHNENQRQSILRHCMQKGLDVAKIDWYIENASTRKTRPIKQDLMNKLRGGEYKTLVIARIDRFARSTIELVMDIENLINHGVRFISVGNNWDWHKNNFDSMSKLQLDLFSAFAEFERNLIRERTLEGLARAKAQGKRLGRPRKTPPGNP